jgi:hypothetical protein
MKKQNKLLQHERLHHNTCRFQDNKPTKHTANIETNQAFNHSQSSQTTTTTTTYNTATGGIDTFRGAIGCRCERTFVVGGAPFAASFAYATATAGAC